MQRLLDGIRILDITTIILGPYVGQILADLGAEVIKVETLEGDIARAIPPAGKPRRGAMFVNNNRNKQSLSVNLKDPRGKAVLERLIERSDVLLHNMRLDAIRRLGFAFEDVRKLNPCIVYCSAVGFGSDGPYKDRPAFDDVIQAASGLAALPLHVGGEPAYVPSVIADKVAALHVVYAVLAALTARARGTVEAVEVEVPMFESLVSFILNEHLAAATFTGPEDPSGCGYPRLFSRNRRPHQTQDGWVAALPYTGQQWKRILLEIGRNDIVESDWFPDAAERSRRIDMLYDIMAEAMPTRTTEDWLATLERLDIPHSKVNDLDDLLRDPHLAAVGLFKTEVGAADGATRRLRQPARFHGLADEPEAPAPDLGEHNRAILTGLGFPAEDIDDLMQAGVIGAVAQHEDADA